MKKNVFRITALMALMMMTLTSFAKTQDWGGRVIDEKGEPMPFRECGAAVAARFGFCSGKHDRRTGYV